MANPSDAPPESSNGRLRRLPKTACATVPSTRLRKGQPRRAARVYGGGSGRSSRLGGGPEGLDENGLDFVGGDEEPTGAGEDAWGGGVDEAVGSRLARANRGVGRPHYGGGVQHVRQSVPRESAYASPVAGGGDGGRVEGAAERGQADPGGGVVGGRDWCWGSVRWLSLEIAATWTPSRRRLPRARGRTPAARRPRGTAARWWRARPEEWWRPRLSIRPAGRGP